MYHTNTWGGRHKEQLDYLVAVTKAKLREPVQRQSGTQADLEQITVESSDYASQVSDKQRLPEIVDTQPLKILLIGPGGVPLSYREACSQKPVRSIKASYDRKMTTQPLWTFEPLDTITAFREYSVDLTVAEIDPRVIDAVPRCFEDAKYTPNSLQVIKCDISKPLVAPLKHQRFDWVLCFAGLPYMQDKQATFENMTLLTDTHGFLSVTQSGEIKSWSLKRFFRTISGRMNEDYVKQIETQVAQQNASYVDVIDLAGRVKFSKVQGPFPVYQRLEDVSSK